MGKERTRKHLITVDFSIEFLTECNKFQQENNTQERATVIISVEGAFVY